MAKAFKTTQAEVDRSNAYWLKRGIKLNFQLGDTQAQRAEKRTAACKAADEMQRKKKSLAAKKRREKLKKDGIKPTPKTAEKKLEENIVRMISRRGLPMSRSMRYAVNEIISAYHLQKK